jgi:hypothetical protein
VFLRYLSAAANIRQMIAAEGDGFRFPVFLAHEQGLLA